MDTPRETLVKGPESKGDFSGRETSLRRSRPLWRRVVNLLILVGLVWLAIRFVDFSRVWQLILGADRRLLVVGVVLATLSRFLMAWKWRRLLITAGVPASFQACLSAYYRGAIVSYVPFMVIGADLLRIHWVGSPLGRRAEVAATVVMEKALGLVSSFLLGSLGLAVILAGHHLDDDRVLMLAGLGGLVASLLLLILSLREGLHTRALAVFQALAPEGVGTMAAKLSSSYRIVGTQRWVLVGVLLLTVCEHLVQFLILFFAGRAIGVDLELPIFLAAISVVTMLRRVAIYLEGWGLAQAASVVVLTLLGLSVEQSLSLSLLADGLSLLAALPGLALLLRDALARGSRGQMEQGT